MRNLKRALSLTLASVMLLGMMVVGSSAAGFPDVTEEDNVEAIEVLKAVDVMIGDDNGNFGPNDPVNRSQMAVVMAKLLNLDYKYYESSCPFWDVPTWARPYVGACYANKIVSGYDATTYGAADTVTAVQAASMMMRALGYFKYSSDYKDGFETATVRQGTRIGIFKGLNAQSNEPLTRNDVAQMALNALKTSVVEPDDNTINIVDGNGNLVATGGQVNYVVVASNESYARAINRTEYVGNGLNQVTGYTVELGEQLYDGKLKLNDDIDPFNRPARAWEYNGKTIGLYTKEELMEFEHVGEVTGKDLYDLLGKTNLEDYTLEVALDGVTDPEIVYAVRGYDGSKESLGAKHNQHYVFDANDINRSNKGSVGDTGTGVLTQVFVDPDYDNGGSRHDGRIWIAVINTYLARANQDYDARREELAVNVYSVDKESGEYVKLDKKGDSEQIRLGVEEFPMVEDASKDDAFLVTLADGEVQTIVPAEVMSGVTVSSFKVKDNVVVDGTKYAFTTTAGFDADALKIYTGNSQVNLKDITYNIFLDAYGNLIGVQEVDAVKNYVFIAAIDINDSNLVNGTANAKAVFLDGTVETIRVNMDKSTLKWHDSNSTPGGYNTNSILNTWCTYTKNNSDVYTVKQVADVSANDDTYVPGGDKNKTNLAQYHQDGFANDYKIDKKHITLQGNNANSGSYARVYGNEKTVYLTAELGNLTNDGGKWGVIKDVDSVTTGAENVNLTVWTNAQAVTEAENSSTPSVDLSGPHDPDYATKGVYTLYNDDGIIIATVVIGEDEGSARNLVYAHTGSIESESYNGSGSNRASGDGMWTWTRKVISNGEEITLTEVSDGNSDLDKMEKNHWYQIKTNGDGEVTGVYKLVDDKDSDLPNANLDRYNDYALNYLPYTDSEGVTLGEIAYTVQNGASTVLYWNQNYIKSHLYMNGRTLYVAHNDQTGFIVNSNVKWVVQQWDSNKEETYIDDGTTAAGLKNMIDEINRRNTVNGVTEDYSYQVSAIIESGIASSVVIYFNENDYNRPGNIVTPTGDAELVWNDVNKDDQYWNLIIPAADYHENMTTAEIANWLSKAGCSNISKTRIGWNFTRNGMDYTDQAIVVIPEEAPATYTVTVAPVENGKVTVNKTTAKAGETITVDATADEGYELDAITVKDADDKEVTFTDGKFTMPASNVTVTVTFKEEAPEVPDGLPVEVKTSGYLMVNIMRDGENLSKTSANYTLDAAKITDIKTGDTLTFDPAAAVVVDGVNENGKVTKQTITIKAAEGWSYNTMLGQWRGPNGYVVSENPWPEVAGMAVNSLFAKRFSFARAADIEEDLNWTSGPNWFRTAIQNGWTKIELRATVTVNGETVNAVEILTITFGEDGSFDIVSTLGEGTTQEALDAMYATAVEDRESVDAVGVEKGEESELPFTLDVTDGKKGLGEAGAGTKASAIQNNVNVKYVKETKTFVVTGDLIFAKNLTEYSNDTNRKVGYFVALDLDWSDMPAEYQIKLATYTDNDPSKFVLKDLEDESKTELLLGKVAGSDGTKLNLEKRGIQVTDPVNGQTTFYKFDFSGLNCPAPELLKFDKVAKEDVATGLTGDSKKISDIQTGVDVNVEETSSTARTVKLTGTLHPVTEAWDKWSNNSEINTGYFVAFKIDGSAMSNTGVNVINPNAKNKTMDAGALDDEDNTLIVRVANLAAAGKQAKTKGNIIVTATNGGQMITYTLDLSGLILEQIGGGDVTVKPMTGTSNLGSVPASSFQKNLSVEMKGDTICISGELNPIKWEEFSSSETKYQKGYYVWFGVDAKGVAGAKALAVQGETIGKSSKTEDDFIGFLGGVDLEKDDIKDYTLYVLSEAMNSETTPNKEKVLKTYTLDFSGVTLIADPGAKPVADYNQITGLGSSVMNEDTSKAKLFFGSNFQDDITFTYDPSTKTYTAAGTLKKVENWLGFSKSEPETRTGWYIAIQLEGSFEEDPTKAGKTADCTTNLTANETCVIRVADKNKNAATQEFYFKVGSGDNAVTIKIDLSGLTLSDTVATPGGQFVSLDDANIENISSNGSGGSH